MATGDIDDFARRIDQLLFPVFGSNDPNVQAIVYGASKTGETLYNQKVYVDKQTRLQTATGDNLDLISKDYFGDEFPRRNGQGDNAYRKMLLALLPPDRGTRPAMENVLEILTGFPPNIFEFWNPGDATCYDIPTGAYGISRYGGDFSTWAYQCLIDVYVGEGSGMGFFSGYNEYSCAYNTNGTLQYGGAWYGNEILLSNVITDGMIYDVIEAFKVYGTICWTKIHRGSSPPSPTYLTDSDGILLTAANVNLLTV